MLNVPVQSFFFRFIIFVLGLSLVAIGIKPLLWHDFFYTNWFGGLVFAPLAILGGLFIAVCAVFKPDWLRRKADPRMRRAGRWR